MKTIYILTSARLNGQIEIGYFNGILNTLKIEFKQPLNPDQFELLKQRLPLYEKNVEDLTSLGLKVSRERTNEKIALFCDFYIKYKKGLKYKVSPADAGKIKLIRIDDNLLTAYFTSDLFEIRGPIGSPGKHSISNLVKYYNELLAEIATAGTSKYPDYYDRKYEARLKTTELPEYWRHLSSLGLKPKKDRFGQTTEWVNNVENRGV